MPIPPGPGNQVIRDLLEKFPGASHQAIARMAYKGRNTSLWPRYDACVLMVRRLRGKQGTHQRKRCLTVKDERRPFVATKQFKLPEGRTEFEDWKPFVIDTTGRALVMSDIHAPWHDSQAIAKCVKEAKRRGIKLLVLNGDTLDAYAISRWQTDPRKRDFSDEVETHNELLGYLREQFPKARRIYKFGNHDERWDAYMQVKCAELLGIQAFAYENVMGLNDHGFEVVKDKRPMQLGKLAVLHGHEYAKTPFGPVNPARGLFLKAVESAMCGHLHRSSHHAEPTLSGHLISCWSTGCLCQMHPEYAAVNKWNQGAAFVEISKDGAYRVDNLRYYGGELW